VAGATGRIGGATARGLTELGVPFSTLIRTPDRRAALGNRAANTVVADFSDEDGLTRALAGTERLLLCSAHGPDMAALQLSAIRAARRAEVRRVVKISASPASIFPGTPAEAAAAHLEVEEALRTSGIQSAIIRPNAFLQGLLDLRSEIDAGLIRLPLGDARVSWVDADDVGRVAARLLASHALPGHMFEVTGPAGLTMDEVCEEISDVSGRQVVYQPVSDETAREALVARGLHHWYANHIVGVFGLYRVRDAGYTTSVVQELTGQAPASVREILLRNRSILVGDPEPSQD
jgi:uncharacterized protein YbjT (DUF2867 family)